MYSREYFEGDFRCGHEGSYFSNETLDHIVDDQLLHRIKEYKPGGRFLEVGCAGGAFLDAARTAGYEVQGVEYSDIAAEFARRNFNLDVRTGRLEQVQFPPDSFDVVFMGDVLEHLPDPGVTMKELNRIMRNGGLIVILCPMQTNTLFSRAGFLVYQILGRKTTVHLPPYHLFEYRPNSLTGLVVKCGFRVTKITESIIPPSEIAQRGSLVQKNAKKLFQYPNYVVTKLFGKLGDRVEMFATKERGVL